jgi:glycosyltransferase involved in cell wall biosynthesis
MPPVTEAPEVTVVVPTRDRWPLLASNALPSALRQEDVVIEVVVVDDGSTDGTATALGGLGDPRVRLIRHERSRGVAAARNAGIGAARAPWVAFLDDDDLWSPRKLRAQVDRAAVTGADVVYAAAVLVDEERRVLASDVFPSPEDLRVRLIHGNLVPGGCSSVLARTSLLRELGGFDERLSYTEDWELWLRLVRRGEVAACAEVLVAHVEHAGNALFRYGPDVVRESEYVVAKHGGDTSRDARSRRRRGILEWTAAEYRRAGRTRQAARVSLSLALERRSLRPALRAVFDLFGSRARAPLARLRSSTAVAQPPQPPWLARFR